jgi:hypothetical protein
MAAMPTHSDFAGLTPDNTARLVERYREAFRIARAYVAVGRAVKVAGVIAGILLGLLMLMGSSSMISAGAGLFMFVLWVLGLGGLGWIFGTIIASVGQFQIATLDVSVYECPFLDLEQKAVMLNLASTARGSATGAAGGL